MNLLKLFKPLHLALFVFAMLIFRYGYLEQQPALLLALNHWQYLLLVLAFVLIGAGGALMDAISGPGKNGNSISEGNGYNIYGALNLAAIGIGYYLADLIGRSSFVAVFVLAACMLFIAVTNFRQTILVGNVLVSLCVAAAILSIAVFNFYPFLQIFEIKAYYADSFLLLACYAVLGFMLTMLYSMTKDIQNMDADYNNNKNTLPIAIGRDRAAKVAFSFTIVTIAAILVYINAYLVSLTYMLIYTLIFMVGPLIFFAIKILGAKTQKDFSWLATVLKLVMALTAVSIMVLTYNIENYA
jgi:4-hydroxybenzoate polyprenyltransferase